MYSSLVDSSDILVYSEIEVIGGDTTLSPSKGHVCPFFGCNLNSTVY